MRTLKPFTCRRCGCGYSRPKGICSRWSQERGTCNGDIVPSELPSGARAQLTEEYRNRLGNACRMEWHKVSLSEPMEDLQLGNIVKWDDLPEKYKEAWRSCAELIYMEGVFYE